MNNSNTTHIERLLTLIANHSVQAAYYKDNQINVLSEYSTNGVVSFQWEQIKPSLQAVNAYLGY